MFFDRGPLQEAAGLFAAGRRLQIRYNEVATMLQRPLQLKALVVLAALLTLPALSAPGDSHAVLLTDFDREILRGKIARKLPCRISVRGPLLGFDFRFHGRFWARIRNKHLNQKGEQLRLVARMTSRTRPESTAYLVRDIPLRAQNEAWTRGTSILGGFTLMGEGEYQLDWFVRDSQGRVCFDREKFKANRSRSDREVEITVPAGEMFFYRGQPLWTADVAQEKQGRLHLKLLLNVPPFTKPNRRLQPNDPMMLLSIVDRIAADPAVSRLDIVAFNLKDREVFFRQEGAAVPDFGGLYRAIESLNNNEVTVESLKPESDVRFLTEMVLQEVAASEDHVDAVVFVGPRVPLRRKIPEEALESLGDAGPPVYYLKYRYTHHGAGWEDSISRVVKAAPEGEEYPILYPRDLWRSVEELIQRLSGSS